MQDLKVKPFLKWAGGKNQLLADIRLKYPNQVDTYCEPFVGGGAVLLDILSLKKPKTILINDINKELINTYIQVQNDVDNLIIELSNLQEKYWKLSIDEKKEFYLSKRKIFNQLKFTDGNSFEKAILFIFLNKTCFNGLYRVNRKG